MSGISERRRRRAEINIVPLVDVLVTLIFFFLVSSQFRGIQTLNITLPKIETAGENAFLQQIEITIRADGSFYYSGVQLPPAGLEDAIRAAAAIDRTLPVIIRSDETSLLRDVTFVMDLCRKAGLDRIQLQSR